MQLLSTKLDATSRNGSAGTNVQEASWWIAKDSGAGNAAGRLERWGSISLVALASALGAVGCASEQADEEPPPSSVGRAPGTVSPTLYGGTADAHDEAVVALEMEMPDGSKELCSGALIAANVVLTARHCVTPTLTKKVVCSEHGTSENGNHFGDDADPKSIHVFRGATANLDAAPDAHGKAVVHDDARIVCDHDVALLVLDRALENVTPYSVRTSGGIGKAEHVNLVGYGKNDVSAPLGTRLQKRDLPILAVGAGTSASKTALGEHEFEVGAGSCGGDSGGPALSAQTGAIIGIVSRGGSCTDDFGHVFTETRDTQELLDRAFALSGGTPVTERGTEDEPAELSEQTAAPSHAAGCSAAPSSGSSSGALAGLGILLGLALVRRRCLTAQ
jgi:MYXO-CTERM domain-containing protein